MGGLRGSGGQRNLSGVGQVGESLQATTHRADPPAPFMEEDAGGKGELSR